MEILSPTWHLGPPLSTDVCAPKTVDPCTHCLGLLTKAQEGASWGPLQSCGKTFMQNIHLTLTLHFYGFFSEWSKHPSPHPPGHNLQSRDWASEVGGGVLLIEGWDLNKEFGFLREGFCIWAEKRRAGWQRRIWVWGGYMNGKMSGGPHIASLASVSGCSSYSHLCVCVFIFFSFRYR